VRYRVCLGGRFLTKSMAKRYREGLRCDSWQRLSKRDTEKAFGGILDKEHRKEIQGNSSVYSYFSGMRGSYTVYIGCGNTKPFNIVCNMSHMQT
jgi:hypothetical protein